jgi:hypothetical protein
MARLMERAENGTITRLWGPMRAETFVWFIPNPQVLLALTHTCATYGGNPLNQTAISIHFKC